METSPSLSFVPVFVSFQSGVICAISAGSEKRRAITGGLTDGCFNCLLRQPVILSLLEEAMSTIQKCYVQTLRWKMIMTDRTAHLSFGAFFWSLHSFSIFVCV